MFLSSLVVIVWATPHLSTIRIPYWVHFALWQMMIAFTGMAASAWIRFAHYERVEDVRDVAGVRA